MLGYNTRELPMWTVSSIKESVAHHNAVYTAVVERSKSAAAAT